MYQRNAAAPEALRLAGGVKPESTIMKIVSLLLAASVAAAIGSAPALAQSADTQSDNSPQSGPQMNAPTHPGPDQWARDRDWYGRPGMGPGGYGWMGPRMMNPHAGWMMRQRPDWMERHAELRHHHGSRGARFTFTRGNARFDIRCPGNQSLKDCVDAASTLIDKVMAMGPKSPPPPPLGAPKPPGQSKPSAGTSGPAPTPGGTTPGKPGNNL